MEEQELERRCVERCLDGDLEAFGPLVERYQRPVFRAVLNMVGNYEDAREVTQQAFLKAFEHLSRYDPQRRFFSWIYRIAINEAINHVKSRREFEALDGDGVGDPGVDPMNALERQRAVREALQALKPDHREVIVLRHFMDCSYEELGETLGLPLTTVKSRLFDARRALRDLLAPLDRWSVAPR